jgi:hypothetical protein
MQFWNYTIFQKHIKRIEIVQCCLTVLSLKETRRDRDTPITELHEAWLKKLGLAYILPSSYLRYFHWFIYCSHNCIERPKSKDTT